MNRAPHPLAAILVAAALFAVGCSGSESENLVPIDTPPPGTLYVSTAAGDIQVITPATGEASVFAAAADNDDQAVLDIAPAAKSTAVHALVRTSDEAFATAVVDVTKSGLVPIEGATGVLTCIDPHAEAATPVAHEATAGGPAGTIFSPVTFGGGTLDTNFELVSVACPRWSADRQVVATATPIRNADPSSIVTVVQTTAGDEYEISFPGCGTTPTSFSPDDEFLALAITCYSASWDDSGLYLLPVDQLPVVGDLSGLTKVGTGLFGRSAWHPDGQWVAAVHADAIDKQNIAVDLSAQPVGLQAIELSTLQTIDLVLADGAAPFSVAWLESALSS